MENVSLLLLSLIVFLPAAGALALAFFPKNSDNAVRYFTLGITIVVCLAIIGPLLLGFPSEDYKFETAQADMQHAFSQPWIPSFSINYFMGLDGISFPLVALTAVVCLFAMGASWSITKHVKAYCILFLLLEMGMLGVFMALDFFLFYVFWEVMLLPMYFLIGVWGGPRKEYAAIKFFLYTLVGSVLMLIAILMLYFAGDVKELSIAQLEKAHLIEAGLESEEGLSSEGLEKALLDLGFDEAEAKFAMTTELSGADRSAALAVVQEENHLDGAKIHTFNILAMQQFGQHTELYDIDYLFGWTLQHWAFLLLFIGFIIKVPCVPFHTWLPDAHVEAPTPVSMILAGVLLKMGGYGILRICYPICPHAGYDFAIYVCILGVVGMVYGAFAALAQKDFKRLVAYSSVSHMGYVVLGLGVWSISAGTMFNAEYWNMGVKGAMFQMIGHGVSSAGMFFCVGVLYDRVHHRDLNQFGGIYGKMPLYTALSMGIFFAGLGLPGLCGFIGEIVVVMSVWTYNIPLAVISASVVVLTAGYILWVIQRVYLGAEYHGPHEEALTKVTPREVAILAPILAIAIAFGVYPDMVFQYMDATIDQQIDDLSDWTIREIQSENEAEKPAVLVFNEPDDEEDQGPADAPHEFVPPPNDDALRDLRRTSDTSPLNPIQTDG